MFVLRTSVSYERRYQYINSNLELRQPVQHTKISGTNLFNRDLFSRILVKERSNLNEYEIRCCSDYQRHLLYHLA